MPGSPASPKAKPAAGQGSGRMQVWVASDGTAGMRLQALALAAAMKRARPDWGTAIVSSSLQRATTSLTPDCFATRI